MNAPLHAPQVLFEMLQSDLDGATEKLSHMLENERGADRAPLVDCTSHAKKRLANFREGVEQGVLNHTNVELMAAQAAEAAWVAKGSQGRAKSAAAGTAAAMAMGGGGVSSDAMAALAEMGFGDAAANAAALASVGGAVDEAASLLAMATSID